jgi:hypothetical protein
MRVLSYTETSIPKPIKPRTIVLRFRVKAVARRLASGAKHERQGKGPPSKRSDTARVPTSPTQYASILEGLKLMQVFLRIETARDRKRVLELARQLAPVDVNTRR